MGAIDAIRSEARATLYEVLVCMAWADRKIAPDEREAIKAAAITLGLVTPRDDVLDALERGAVPLEELPFEWLTQREKELTYLCASWMVLADGEAALDETMLLEKMRTMLKVDERRAAWLRQRALSMRTQTPPSTSWWREFDTLVVDAARALDSPS